jgi:hypothetical protein
MRSGRSGLSTFMRSEFEVLRSAALPLSDCMTSEVEVWEVRKVELHEVWEVRTLDL